MVPAWSRLHRNMKTIIAVCLAAVLGLGGGTDLLAAEKLVLYSTLNLERLSPLLQRFSEQTGIDIESVQGSEQALFERLGRETGSAAADLFVGEHAAQMQRAEQADLLEAVTSQALEAGVQKPYRDPEGYWYAFGMFVRPIVYKKDKVDTYLFFGYEEMAREKWKGRICLSGSDNPYNRSLVASMLASNGEDLTRKWLKTLVANLARAAGGSDRDQLAAIQAGTCDLTLANTDLYGRLSASADAGERALVAGLGLLWANQPDRGVHANFRGIGLNVHAPHRANAIRFMEYLVTEENQRWLASHDWEYPVRDMYWPHAQRLWGRFKSDSANMPQLAELDSLALKLMQEAGWK